MATLYASELTSSNHGLASRYHGLDILRVAAALGVVLLHAGMPYLVHPMPGLVWPVADMADARIDFVGWGIEVVIMPIFLMLAGYFSVPSLRRLGTRRFFNNRFQRLLLPLLLIGPLLLVADCYIWLLGWVIDGHIELRKVRSMKFTSGVDQGLWGTSHLWFLLYVYLYAIIYGVLASKQPQAASAKRSFVIFSGFVVCSLGILACRPDVVFGFQHAFLPVLPKFLYSGCYFAGGILLANEPKILAGVQQRLKPLGAVAITSLLLAVFAGWQWLERIELLPVPGKVIAKVPAAALWWNVPVALCTVTAAWSVTLILIATLLSRDTAARSTLRYLAAASFWVYLIHHPILGLCHINLKVYFPALHPLAKFVISSAVAIIVSIMTFEVFCRRGRMARLLAVPADLQKDQVIAAENEVYISPLRKSA